MRVGPGQSPRRVKRLFADAGIAGMDRAGWPVVLADGEIVWIPGVRRADAASITSTSSGRWLRYVCERNVD
jgi:tRNA(Ile)-lysidine synthase